MKVVFKYGGAKAEPGAVFLLKPFTVSELINTVERTLRVTPEEGISLDQPSLSSVKYA